VTTISRRLEIDAGHRLIDHEGKCAHVHGHRYVFEVFVRASQLDHVGRVIDFSVVKERVGGWLDMHWDHGFLAQEGDPIIDWLSVHAQKLYVLPVPPSAENLAAYVFEVARRALEPEVQVVAVRCHETPNCYAEFRADDQGR